jgi:hypothetical protein
MPYLASWWTRASQVNGCPWRWWEIEGERGRWRSSLDDVVVREGINREVVRGMHVGMPLLLHTKSRFVSHLRSRYGHRVRVFDPLGSEAMTRAGKRDWERSWGRY